MKRGTCSNAVKAIAIALQLFNLSNHSSLVILDVMTSEVPEGLVSDEEILSE